jgi:hypothetical protein
MHTEQLSVSRLERVPLREIWPHEERDFTVWLANNFDVLNGHLEYDLVSAEAEQAAGEFRVDIVAEDVAGNTVVVENQLERSDHDHLGKTLTYLAAYEAAVAIWITKDARDEHVKAVGWLNDNTPAAFYLFELQTYRIGGSPAAPLLVKLVGPSVTGRRAVTEREANRRRQDARRDLFTRILASAKAVGVKTHVNRTGTDGPYLASPIVAGKGWARLGYGLAKTDTSVYFEIDFGADRADDNRDMMNWFIDHHRVEIDASFGPGIDWNVEVDGRIAKARALVGAGGWSEADRLDTEIVPKTADAMRRLEAAVVKHVKAANPHDVLGAQTYEDAESSD